MTSTPAAGTVAHVAINADDLDAARRFYGAVFGWRFKSWGPPGFLKITRSDGSLPGPIGALQDRRDLVAGARAAVEITVAVEDVDRACAEGRAAGGRVLMEKTVLPGVGELAFLQDPSGIPIGVMRYTEGQAPEA
jgi:predicted enzyme related to lactoylglutathione lyase